MDYKVMKERPMNYKVIKKAPNLYQFADDYQANRFYTILKDRLRLTRKTMVDIDKMLMDMYGSSYDPGDFSPSWRDWSHFVKSDDIILRCFSRDYATLYFKGVDDNEERQETIKDLKAHLMNEISATIEQFVKNHPNVDTDGVENCYLMVKVKDLEAKKIVILEEVKDE